MTEEKSGDQWRLWRLLFDLCCHSRSCETDVQCKKGCKCWVRLDCEDPPQTSRSAKLGEGNGEYSADSSQEEDEIEEEEDVQESSNEKNPEGYQNAVSTYNFILLLEISDVKRVLMNGRCGLYRRNPRVDRKTWLYLVYGVVFFYPVLRVSEVIFQEAVVADTILVRLISVFSDGSCALY